MIEYPDKGIFHFRGGVNCEAGHVYVRLTVQPSHSFNVMIKKLFITFPKWIAGILISQVDVHDPNNYKVFARAQ